MYKIFFIFREILRGKSVLRSFLNYRLSSEILRGRTIDVGGGKNQSYIAFMKSTSDYMFTSFDKKLGYEIDFEIDDLPILSDSVDTVLFLNVMEHIFNYQHLAGEVVRILKPGGQLIGFVPFLMWYHPDHRDFFRYTHEAINIIFERAGVSSVRVESLAHGPFTAGLQMVSQFLPRLLSAIIFPPVYFLDSLYLRFRPHLRDHFALGYYFKAKI